jgi:hypothetical protein
MHPVKFRANMLWRAGILLGLVLVLGLRSAQAFIDTNNDGLDDLWQAKYGAQGLLPGGDANGTGQTNAVKCAAGLNPFAPNAVFAIKSLTMDAGGAHIAWATVAGKGYQLQSTTSLTATNWQNEGGVVAGTGSNTIQTVSSSGGTTKFYHVLVQDMYSAGDNVSDWERMQLGFNILLTHNQGATGPDDASWLAAAVQATNVVTINATVPTASKAGLQPGKLTITRTGNLNAITVNYTVSGSAVPGTDMCP